MNRGGLALVTVVIAWVAGSSCGPAGRQMGSPAAMRQRQDLWGRCVRSIETAQCGSGSLVYGTVCMRRLADRYFDTTSMEAARAVAVSYGCSESIAGVSSGASSRPSRPSLSRTTWTDDEMRGLIVRINAAVVSCFAVEHVPATVRMTIDVQGHVAAHEVTSEASRDEVGCVARTLVAVDVEGAGVQRARDITASFGDRAAEPVPPIVEAASLRARRAASTDHDCALARVTIGAEHDAGFWLDVCGVQRFYRPEADVFVEQER